MQRLRKMRQKPQTGQKYGKIIRFNRANPGRLSQFAEIFSEIVAETIAQTATGPYNESTYREGGNYSD